MARILIIEDDPDMGELLSEILTSGGHDVFIAGNGEDGLRVLDEKSPDLLLTDILMPEKDGFDFLMELRLRKSMLKVIAISGAPAHWMVLKVAADLGAHRTLTKPFTRSEITEAVDAVLAGA